MTAPTLEHRATGLLNAVMCCAVGAACLVFCGFALWTLAERASPDRIQDLIYLPSSLTAMALGLPGSVWWGLALVRGGLRMFHTAAAPERANPGSEKS